MQTELRSRPQHTHRAPSHHQKPLFKSFWLGGFESACQINTRGVRIDMLAATQHDKHCLDDYQMLRHIGIRTVRDGVRWPCVEQSSGGAGQYDWSTFIPMLRAARSAGTQVIWNLLHYGWPPDIDILSNRFVDRFARFCREAARIVREESDEVPFYVPVNEISFLAWAVGHKGIIQPVNIGRAWEIKKQLIRAAIAGMESVWSIDPRARFAHVDPVLHVVPPRDCPDMAQQAYEQREAQFQAWDMLAGRLEPSLGGAPKYLDLIGLNYYHSNQFECPDIRLRWEDDPRDDRWIPFHKLLDEVHRRYQRPVFVAETSHFGAGRARWIKEIAQEVYIARIQGVPVEGVCLYPIIDRPDWEDPNHWHNSGLFDLSPKPSGTLHRLINSEYLSAFRWAQALMSEVACR